jgi:hypothetical protein
MTCTRDVSVADDVPLRVVRLARLSCGCYVCADELSISQAVERDTEQTEITQGTEGEE